MLDSETKRRIDTARDILVGKIPDPKSQVEQITIALIYKFMDDMDRQAERLPRGKATFFIGEYKKYAWHNILNPQNSGENIVILYGEALQKMNFNKNVPQLFRDIFKNAYLPYRDPETLKDFLKEINTFEYDHSERLGDAFEYLLSVLGSQGDAGQFRTPRNIIDFMVEIIEPKKNEKILDPACGTAGFLISAYKHIQKRNSKNYDAKNDPKPFELQDIKLSELTVNGKGYRGEKLTSDDKKRLVENITGYDISPDMVRLSLVNMYLHGFSKPHISEYDTLSRDDKWDEKADVILANPPFMSPKGGIKPHDRFSVKSKRSEVLFVDYMAEHLTKNGRAAIIVPEGVVFKGDSAYKQLRKMLVDEKYLIGVISLPAGVFNPYSGIKTYILWLDKSLAKKTDNILFVKIENDGFDLGAQRRPIKENDLPEAYTILMKYKEALNEGRQFEEEDYQKTKIIDRKAIAQNTSYCLNEDKYGPVRIYKNVKWPMVELGEVLDYEQPTKYIVKSIDYDDEYTTPVLTAGKSFILGYTNEREGIFKKDLPVIIFDDFTTSTKYVDFPFKVKSSAMKILHAKKIKANIKFIFHVMQEIDFISSTHKRYWISEYSKIKIPLPPLNVQEQIVAEIEEYQQDMERLRNEIDAKGKSIKDSIAQVWGMK